jgi:YD repeat-containing protein
MKDICSQAYQGSHRSTVAPCWSPDSAGYFARIGSGGFDDTYGYDADGQLFAQTRGGLTTNVLYDAAGNRANTTTAGGVQNELTAR